MKRLLFIFISLFFIQSSSYSQEDSIKTDEIHQTINSLIDDKEAFPVVIENDTIFNIYEKVGSKSKTDYVELCKLRINSILSRDFYRQDSLIIRDSANYIQIAYSNNTVMEFSNITAGKLDRSKSAIAEKYKEKVWEYLSRVQPGILWEKLVKESNP